ncbi:TIGR03546 family protein [candidate division KSB1 bacterium]|nr:TIGR03546 family protein [candidate division KSB1 bacterium]
MIIIKLISKFIKVLSSAASPNQIAWGFALGTIPGLTPINALHNAVVLILLIILNVNISSALFALLIYSLFAWMLDPFFHAIGYYVLAEIPALTSFWTSLYNAPIAPLTRFNNTVVMGSFLVAIALLIPHYLLFKWFVRKYRDTWNEKIKKWKITKAITGSKVVKLYLKFKDVGE